MAGEIKKVGVIRGGIGDFYEASIRDGGLVISHIMENLADKFRPVDILVDRAGKWHVGGLPTDLEELSQKADMFWDTTRSDAYLSLKNVPLVCVAGGTETFSEKSRKMLREHAEKLGIKMPSHLVFPAYFPDIDGPLRRYAEKKAKEIFEKFSPPWRVRPFSSAKNSEIILAETFPELVEAINRIASLGTGILAEKFISGKNAKMHSVLGFRKQELYVFPPIGSFTALEKEVLHEHAKSLHEYIGGSDYLCSDFTLGAKGKPYLTDLEFSPNLEEGSPFDLVCQSVGAKTHHVTSHILEQVIS